MFTGLVEETGKLVKIETRGKDLRLSIEAGFEVNGLQEGESVSVNGVCLTVVSWNERVFTADVSQETLDRTTISRLRLGDAVNLERALRLGDRLGGHLVNGHVDGKARVVLRKKRGDSIVFGFEVAPELAHYLIEKGSVAVDGVSLTINRCDEKSFEINLVPHSARVTNMGNLKVGDQVNIEVDVIGKYVEKFIRNMQKRTSDAVNADFLAKHGFI